MNVMNTISNRKEYTDIGDKLKTLQNYTDKYDEVMENVISKVNALEKKVKKKQEQILAEAQLREGKMRREYEDKVREYIKAINDKSSEVKYVQDKNDKLASELEIEKSLTQAILQRKEREFDSKLEKVKARFDETNYCLLYTSDAADE
eukprot:TRINITY_DN9855_c0_g1_i2.p1 TRINITY_DN9855_c0_g1~~TRINITY_DN9855_c0_g1_i2.p1  ORF type:complete len:148 (+),score=32.74 TRINITY_DN9855_c0_g1_i2:86-529(+)